MAIIGITIKKPRIREVPGWRAQFQDSNVAWIVAGRNERIILELHRLPSDNLGFDATGPVRQSRKSSQTGSEGASEISSSGQAPR